MMKKITLLSFILVNLLILNTKSFAQNLNNVDWDNKYSIEINNTFIDAELNNWTLVFDQNFSSLLTAANGPLDADGSRPSINGGGDIRFSSDENGTTELAFDIRTWVTDNDPNTATCEVAVNIPVVSETNNTTIYMWWGNSSANTYGVSDTYGQYNAYDDSYALVSPNGGDADRTINANNGTPSSGLSLGGVSGKLGAATAYNGSGDFVQIADNSSIDFDEELTISLWTYRTGNPAPRWMKFVSKWNNYFIALDTLDLNSGLKVESGIYGAVWETADQAFTTSDRSTTLPINSWHKLELVYSETSGQIKLYLDNTLIVSESPAAMVTSDADLLFAKSQINVENQYYNGIMDEIRLSSVARTDAWRNAEYHNLFNPVDFTTFADETLGNNSNVFENIGIYPNPTNNFWTIRAKKQIINSVEVYNVLGERVLYTKPNSSSININASNLAPGLYFSTINTDLGSVTKKLIKN